MDFGTALKALKDGKRVARSVWRPKGYWIVLVPASKVIPRTGRPLGTAAPDLVGTTLNSQAHIVKWVGHGRIIPWTASHDALLAEDWTII